MKEKVGHNFGNPFPFPLFLVSQLKPSTFPCMDKTINKKNPKPYNGGNHTTEIALFYQWGKYIKMGNSL